jgi:hypothetical protein
VCKTLVTAREAFEAKKLAQKYGVIGKVAGLYRTAGYKIESINVNEDADLNFLAVKRGEKLGVKVFTKSTYVPVEIVEKLKKACEELKSRPILILYGSGPKLKDEIITKAKELGVSIRRVRP